MTILAFSKNANVFVTLSLTILSNNEAVSAYYMLK